MLGIERFCFLMHYHAFLVQIYELDLFASAEYYLCLNVLVGV